MSAPLVSVIIVCRNPGLALHTALRSLWEQAGTGHEIIVVDGASTDGTREWLEANRSRLTVLISEPDTGVYDAMNKGIGAAHGQWLLFLGADDRLADSRVLVRVQPVAATTTARLLCGETAYSDGRIWRAPTQPNLRYRNFLHHQACFYHRSVFVSHAYDETFPVQADYDLNLRLWHAGIRPVPLPIRVAVCGTGGLSDGGSWANYRDEIRVRHRHFPAWQCWPWDAGSIMRFVRKQFIRCLS